MVRRRSTDYRADGGRGRIWLPHGPATCPEPVEHPRPADWPAGVRISFVHGFDRPSRLARNFPGPDNYSTHGGFRFHTILAVHRSTGVHDGQCPVESCLCFRIASISYRAFSPVLSFKFTRYHVLFTESHQVRTGVETRPSGRIVPAYASAHHATVPNHGGHTHPLWPLFDESDRQGSESEWVRHRVTSAPLNGAPRS